MKISKNEKSGRIILVGLALILGAVLVATAAYDYRLERPIQLGVSGGNFNDMKFHFAMVGLLVLWFRIPVVISTS